MGRALLIDDLATLKEALSPGIRESIELAGAYYHANADWGLLAEFRAVPDHDNLARAWQRASETEDVAALIILERMRFLSCRVRALALRLATLCPLVL